MAKNLPTGTAHHAEPERNVADKAPVVGQSRPYDSGDNARGQHQPRTRGPAPGSSAGNARGDGPKSGYSGR